MGRELSVNPTPASEFKSPEAARRKLRVALISVGAALFLTSAKAIVGVMTGSLALLSEAAHSGLDLFASVVTALSVKAADRPADKTHHYGHGKIESLSALFETVLLSAVCGWIIYHAGKRLLGSAGEPSVNAYSFTVIILAIGIDLYRYRALMKVARRYHSQALEADALHFYSDILSSSLVLVGLIAVALGFPIADALAAILVAIWVAILAFRLGRKNADILLDHVPEGYIEDIYQTIKETPGVLNIENLRLRRSGSSLFADLRVSMDRTLPFEQAHQIARELEEKLARQIPGLDAVVHTDPAMSPHEALDGGILNFIRTRGLQAHHLSLRQQQDRLHADLHLEVDGQLTVLDAHTLASQLEDELTTQFPDLTSVQIHLEDRVCHPAPEIPLGDGQPEMIDKIASLCEDIVGVNRCHGISVTQRSGQLSVSLHCLFPGNLPIAEAHRKTTQLEEELRRSIPDLDRVLIHAEPLS